MMSHGVDNPLIEYRDSLSDQNPDEEKFSLIMANLRELEREIGKEMDELEKLLNL
jgi:hypothetical protein